MIDRSAGRRGAVGSYVASVVFLAAETPVAGYELQFLGGSQFSKARGLIAIIVSREIVELDAEVVDCIEEGGHSEGTDVVDFHSVGIAESCRRSRDGERLRAVGGTVAMEDTPKLFGGLEHLRHGELSGTRVDYGDLDHLPQLQGKSFKECGTYSVV